MSKLRHKSNRFKRNLWISFDLNECLITVFAKRGRFECVEPEIKSKNCSFSWKFKMRWFLFRLSKCEADHEDLYNAEMNIGEWVRGFHRTRVVAEHTHCHYSSLFLLPEVSIFIHSKRSPQQLMKLRVFCCQASKWIDFFWRSFCTGVKRTMKSGGIMIAGFIVNENSDNSRSFFLFAGDLIFLACSHISQSSSEENVICHWKTR